LNFIIALVKKSSLIFCRRNFCRVHIPKGGVVPRVGFGIKVTGVFIYPLFECHFRVYVHNQFCCLEGS